MNKESLRFFILMVREATLRNSYYNGSKNLLFPCMTMERESTDYMNSVLAKMRGNKAVLDLLHELGIDSVPDDIPLRISKEKSK